MTIALDFLLAVAVFVAWLAVLLFLCLRSGYDRLHVNAVVNVSCGTLLVAAAFLVDGISSRSLKCALVLVASLVFGALFSHVTSRALHLRAGGQQ
jgi:multisubunit Na+/H+ antiporter MnhG subunit